MPRSSHSTARDSVVEEAPVVAHQHVGAVPARQLLLQPFDGRQVEMVGRLVEQHDVGLADQRAGQCRAPRLAARQFARRAVAVELHLLEHARRRGSRTGPANRSAPRRHSAATLAWPVKSGSCGRVAMVAPGWAKRVPPSAIGSPARMRSRVDLPAPLRPTSDSRSPGAMASSTPSRIGLVAEVEADAGERQQGWFGHGLGKVGRAVMAEAVHNGKGLAAAVWSRMLRPVGEPRRIDRAIRRLQGALKGVPARGVRLTWRGGELRTTIHWARDDSFWWAFEPRSAQRAGAAAGPRARCADQAREHHLRDQPAARRRRPEGGGHHRRRRCRRALSRPFRPHGRHAARPAQGGLPRVPGRRRVAAPHLARRRGDRGADRGAARQSRASPACSASSSIRCATSRRAIRRPHGPASASSRRWSIRRRRRATAGWSTWRCTRSSPSAACSAAPTISSRCAASARNRCSRWWPTDGPRSSRWPWARCRSPRRAAAPTCGRSWWRRPRCADRDDAALQALPFACVRFRWRGARAVFDGLDDALA